MAKQYRAIEWSGVDLKTAALLGDVIKNSSLQSDISSLAYDSQAQIYTFSAAGDDLSTLDTFITDLCSKAALPKPSTKIDSLPGLRLMAASDVATKVPPITDKSQETKTAINKGIVATAIDAVVGFFSELFA